MDAVGGLPEVEEGKMGKTGFALSYLDNEGDTVSMTTDKDVLEAITLSQHGHRDKVDLFVHHPDSPPLSSTLDPHPGLARPPSPPESSVRQRKRYDDEEDDEDIVEERPRREPKQASASTQQEQLVSGVPNELLLPGAIVTLAVVIVGVFAMTRSSSR